MLAKSRIDCNLSPEEPEGDKPMSIFHAAAGIRTNQIHNRKEYTLNDSYKTVPFHFQSLTG